MRIHANYGNSLTHARRYSRAKCVAHLVYFIRPELISLFQFCYFEVHHWSLYQLCYFARQRERSWSIFAFSYYTFPSVCVYIKWRNWIRCEKDNLVFASKGREIFEIKLYFSYACNYYHSMLSINTKLHDFIATTLLSININTFV